ncbi:MAG: hypothetical protein IT262_19055 [Saprospiraceae bacterium]|nr:hypothetical protein [Saprospiraceae bacterium]
MKKTFLLVFCLSATVIVKAQYGPRLFLDIPAISFAVPDVTKPSARMGMDLGTAFNVGTHWSVARVGGGGRFSLSPDAEDIAESFQINPYLLAEVGAGIYRSNGNKCSRTQQNAFTILAKGGVNYSFYTKDEKKITNETGVIDYTVGAEFGYFFIRDIFKNYELFLSANYHTKAEVLSGNIGLKLFLNLKADRD